MGIRFVLGKDLTPKEAASNCFAVFLFGTVISIKMFLMLRHLEWYLLQLE